MSMNVPNPNINPLDVDKTSGINKHLYSTNPDRIVGENIYSSDKTSINKEESYQTLDNKTIPVDTGERVNPFHVKGVPGCKSCGGSGWKETAKHPHPCNECAKRTVPVIDTYLTKVGHTTAPIAETVPATETYYSSEVIQERDYLPTREVTVTKEVPVTREFRYTEEVPVRTQVPVTRFEEKVENVPVERVEYVTENVPVTTTVPVTSVDQTIRNEQTTLPTSGVGLTTGVTQEVYPGVNPALSGTTISTVQSSNIPVRLDEDFSGYQDINREVERNRLLVKDSHTHDDKLLKGTDLPVGTTTTIGTITTGQTLGQTTGYLGQTIGTTSPVMNFVGVPGCKECGGDGWRRSKLTGAKKPCKHCVSITGNCPLCGNTGRRLDKDKKCKCIYAK
jgi:hypothetical protein